MGVLAKQFTYHQLHSAANLVPPHRHHLPVVQHDMVAGRVLIRVVHRALEHGAVHSPGAPLVAARCYDYPVPTLEAVIVAHAGTVGGGSTDSKGRVSSAGGRSTGQSGELVANLTPTSINGCAIVQRNWSVHPRFTNTSLSSVIPFPAL